MTLQNKGTYKDKLTIYTTQKATIKEAKEILKREGSSLSEFINEKIAEYVRLHRCGNPQQRIDIIMFNKSAYKAPKFCEIRGCSGQATGFGVYQKTGKKYALCKAHFKMYGTLDSWKILEG
jgi:hypothetical protein